jgi:hypothetical protein
MNPLLAYKCPLAIRLLELLHTQPEIWVPYKELSLPERIPNICTMNSEELREMLNGLPIRLHPADFTVLEASRKLTQETTAECFEVLAQLLRLVVPAVDVRPAEIPWAFTIAQTRSVLTNEENARGFGTGHLIPLFDMLNHASAGTCSVAPASPSHLAARAAAAAQAAPEAQLSVAAGPDGAALLLRGGWPLGRLDDCVILRAPGGGLRAGEEARLQYQDPMPDSPAERVKFAVTYGFYPE